VGEYQARKLGAALGLTGKELDNFVYKAINGCTEKVLQEAKSYPAELLNLLARQLRHAGIPPDEVHSCIVSENTRRAKVAITLNNGRKAELETKLALAA
jgi:hypothetical protein